MKIQRLEYDFPFLYGVIQFRISITGLRKEQRARYANLWIGKEKKRHLMTAQELEKERNRYEKQLDQDYKLIDPKEKELLINIRQSCLRTDLRRLIGSRHPGTEFKKMEDDLFQELEAWVIETEDDFLRPLIMNSFQELKSIHGEFTATRFAKYHLNIGANTILSLDPKQRKYYINTGQMARAWSLLDSSVISSPDTILSSTDILTKNIVIAVVILFILPSFLRGTFVNVNNSIIGLGIAFFFCVCGLFLYNSKSKNFVLKPLEFSQNFSVLTNQVFKKTLETICVKKAREKYEPKLADLPTLLPLLSSYLQEEEKISKVPKAKKRAAAISSTEPAPAAEGKTQDTIWDRKNKTNYILLKSNQHFKLNKKDIVSFFPKKSGVSDQMFNSVKATILRHRKVDLIGEGEQQDYPGMKYKLRLDVMHKKYRVGMISRKPNESEKSLGIDKEVLSPRMRFSH